MVSKVLNKDLKAQKGGQTDQIKNRNNKNGTEIDKKGLTKLYICCLLSHNHFKGNCQPVKT